MGQLSHDPHIQHFSHPHLLELTNHQSVNIATPCSCCKLQPSGWMYTCKPCNFILHISCTQMPYSITHPSHPKHTLSLLPTSAYPGGLFNCDGCGHQGQGFTYHCNHCDFDVHTFCASMPLSLAHQSHPHQLTLTFDPPYHTKAFSCDICHKIGSNHWLYRCPACQFDAHLECATNTPRPSMSQPQPQVTHYNSFPGAYNMQQSRNNRHAGGMNYYVHSQSMGLGPLHNHQVAATTGTNASGGNALMGTAVQGFVDGVAQQVGQTFVQSIMNDGSGSGSGSGSGNGSGSGGSSSLVSIGSSILSGIFGDSDTQN